MATQKETKFKVTIEAPKNIETITKENDKYIFQYTNGSKEEKSLKDAIYAIVGIQTLFLAKRGKIKPDGYDIAKDPTAIFDTFIIDNKPVLTEAETCDCLSHLMYGMYKYHNKRCNHVMIGYGIGYMLYKLFEPYCTCAGSYEVFRIYYKAISIGLFSLQLKRKLLTRYVYKGLYEAWPMAMKQYNLMFTKSIPGATGALIGIYDDLLKCEDLRIDPIHDQSQYPSNLNHYSVDNLILCFAAIASMAMANKKYHYVDEATYRDYIYAQERIREFVNVATPLYKKKCDLLNSGNVDITERKYDELYHVTKEISKCFLGRSCMVLDNTTGQLKTDLDGHLRLSRLENLYNVDVPYLRYTYSLFASYGQNPDSYYYKATEYACKYTGLEPERMDMDCLIFGERNTTEWIKDVEADRHKEVMHRMYGQLAVMGIIALIGYGFYVIIGPKAILFALILCVFSGGFTVTGNKKSNSNNEDTDSELKVFYSLSSGKLEFGYWL